MGGDCRLTHSLVNIKLFLKFYQKKFFYFNYLSYLCNMKYIQDNEGNLLEDPAWDIVRNYNIFMKSHVEYILELYKKNE